tara:strand:- start:541 stop:726 length:186 start_codon:yes stop_codon:yes gene_type:complete
MPKLGDLIKGTEYSTYSGHGIVVAYDPSSTIWVKVYWVEFGDFLWEQIHNLEVIDESGRFS